MKLSTIPQRLGHQLRPLPRPLAPPRQRIEIFPPHDAAEPGIILHEGREGAAQEIEGDGALAVGRVGQDADDDLVRGPAVAADDGVVGHEIRERAPVVVELHVVPGDAAAAHDFQGFVVEAGEVREAALEGGRDGAEGEEEGGAEVGVEPVDQPDDARE